MEKDNIEPLYGQITNNKDYSDWFSIKPKINVSNEKFFTKNGEIWYCYWGTNIGYELDGKGVFSIRPVLVFKKTSKNTFLCFPLTNNGKKLPMYFKIKSISSKSSVVLDQIRSIDSKRLIRFVDVLSAEEYKEIRLVFIDYVKNETPPLVAGNLDCPIKDDCTDKAIIEKNKCNSSKNVKICYCCVTKYDH